MLVWRVLKGLPWRRLGNSQPFLRRMWSGTASLPVPMRIGRQRGCGIPEAISTCLRRISPRILDAMPVLNVCGLAIGHDAVVVVR